MLKKKLQNYNTKLTEKLQNYQHYHQVKLINMTMLLAKKYYLPIESKFTYSTLEKGLQNQTKKHVDTLMPLHLFNKID